MMKSQKRDCMSLDANNAEDSLTDNLKESLYFLYLLNLFIKTPVIFIPKSKFSIAFFLNKTKYFNNKKFISFNILLYMIEIMSLY